MSSKLREVQQSAKYGDRRWFNSVNADLYVWHEEGEIIRFEYSYDKPHDEHILVWKLDTGFEHMQIDDGEANPGKNQSPIIGQEVRPDFEKVARDFRERGVCIEADIYRFVMEKLYSRI